ncbi:MAG: hypothetical protein DU489_09940 [Nitrosomonas sp.]
MWLFSTGLIPLWGHTKTANVQYTIPGIVLREIHKQQPKDRNKQWEARPNVEISVQFPLPNRNRSRPAKIPQNKILVSFF